MIGEYKEFDLTATVLNPDKEERSRSAYRLVRAAAFGQAHDTLTKLARGDFWGSLDNTDVTEVASRACLLASALMTIITGAKSGQNRRFLVEGLEGFVPNAPDDADAARHAINERLFQMKHSDDYASQAWTSIETVYTIEDDPFADEADPLGLHTSEVPEFSEYAHRKFEYERHEYEAKALQDFGLAVCNLIIVDSRDEPTIEERIRAVVAFLSAYEITRLA